MPCSTASETCGGSLAIQIYSGTASTQVIIPPNSGGYNCVDTFTDSSDRVLPVQYSLSSTTVANCVSTCSNNGYKYAGLEYGSQCFCGSSVLLNPAGGQTPTMRCQGNANQYCGGPHAIQVYQGTPSPQTLMTPFTNGQCVTDNANNQRTLSVTMPSANNMTPAVCRTACQGYTYYGVEYANECYCGNSFPAGTTLSSSCNMACSGDGTQTCGGPNALSIYNS